jgi:putative RecB family exonuclease
MRDHISVSQINQYLMCPLKYRFHYIDQLPRPFKPADLALGSAIHAAVEWWHKNRMINGGGPEWQDVVRIFEADLQAQALDTIRYKNGENIESLIEKGKQVLAVYLKEYRGAGIRAAELPFRVPLVDLETGEALSLPLDGYIDLVEADDTVVELKTAAKVYSPIEVVQHLQLSAYTYAFGWLYKRKPKLRLDILTKGKNPALHSFEVYRDKDSLVRFFHIAKGVLRAIQEGHFYPNQGWQCPTCEYFDVCQKWRNWDGKPSKPEIKKERIINHVTKPS